MANASDVKATAALEPDFLGFIFWPGSKRAVRPEDVGAWTEGLPASIGTVGVFVDASAEEMNAAGRAAGLDLLQLHGAEPPEVVEHLDFPAWKVIHIDRMSPDDAAAYSAEAFLVDSYTRELPGGTGKTVDWEMARRFVASADRSVLLAGGLTPENVGEAVRQVQPWGVDVSSGVEQSPGKKDMQRVKQFIEASRKA